jgi:hypothetical protein
MKKTAVTILVLLGTLGIAVLIIMLLPQSMRWWLGHVCAVTLGTIVGRFLHHNGYLK